MVLDWVLGCDLFGWVFWGFFVIWVFFANLWPSSKCGIWGFLLKQDNEICNKNFKGRCLPLALPVTCLPRPPLHLGGIKRIQGSCETCVSESTALTHPTAASLAVTLVLTPQTARAWRGSVCSLASSRNVFAGFLTKILQPNRTGRQLGFGELWFGQCPPLGPVAKLPPADPAVQAVPGALVNEELVLHRAERGISSGFAPFLHPKRDPEHAGRVPTAPQGTGMRVEEYPGFMGKMLGPCRNWEYIVSLRWGCFFLFQFSGELVEPFTVSCLDSGFSSFNK